MGKFADLDWTRFDVDSVVCNRGLGSIEASLRGTALHWLQAAGYERIELDFLDGISPVVARLGQMLDWETEFGYTLEPASRNLDALWDGFDFQVSPDGGLVLWLRNFGTAIDEDPRWSQGFCELISGYSVAQLALGRWFFAVAEIPEGSGGLVVWRNDVQMLGNPFRGSFSRGPR